MSVRYFLLSKSPTGVVVAREVPDEFDSLPDLNEPGEHVVSVEDLAEWQSPDYWEISATSWFDPEGRLSLRTTEPLPVALVAYARLIQFFGDVESFGHTPTTHASVLPLPEPEPLVPESTSLMVGFVGFAGLV